MPPISQYLRHLWLPAILLGVVLAQYFHWFELKLPHTPRITLALTGLALTLGVFFKSSRVAYSAALVLLGLITLELVPQMPSGGAIALALAVSAFNMALIAPTQDRSVLSGYGLLLGGALALQIAGFYYLLQCCSSALSMNLLPLLADGPMSSAIGLASYLRPPELLFGAAALICALAIVVRADQVSAGLFGAVILCLLSVSLLGDVGTDGLRRLALLISLTLVWLALRSVYELAFRDELTGIPSRRAYSRYLLTLGRNYSIAVIDIDHFKKLNDRHGHQVGDQALRMVAGRIARFGGGRAFRYGGEEFVVVLRGADRERAERSLERMREKIASYPLRLRASSRSQQAGTKARRRRGQGGGKAIKTTVSVGIATSGGKLRSPEEVLKAADRALYKAKRSGRNRVCMDG